MRKTLIHVYAYFEHMHYVLYWPTHVYVYVFIKRSKP